MKNAVSLEGFSRGRCMVLIPRILLDREMVPKGLVSHGVVMDRVSFVSLQDLRKLLVMSWLQCVGMTIYER